MLYTYMLFLAIWKFILKADSLLDETICHWFRVFFNKRRFVCQTSSLSPIDMFTSFYGSRKPSSPPQFFGAVWARSHWKKLISFQYVLYCIIELTEPRTLIFCLLKMLIFYRYIHMLIYTILLIIHGEEDLICQKKWRTHI